MLLLRRHLGSVLATALLTLAASVAVVETWALWENSLRRHPQWVATKPTLGRGVMGALAFASGPQAVARNRLNLGAWLGFQEVLTRDAVDLARLALRFRVEPEGYVHVLYGVGPDGFSGLRLSHRSDAPSLYYRAGPDGEFTATRTLDVVRIAPNAWHALELSFSADAVDAALDGAPLGRFERASSGAERFGFRGGLRQAEVDDVEVEERGVGTRTERFANRERRGPRLAFVAASLGAAAFAAAALLRRTQLSPRQVGFAVATASFVLASSAAAAYAFVYVRGGAYRPAAEDARAGEAYWIDSSRREVVSRIRASYPERVPPGTWRLLVLGTSQTWGAGARSEAETWVRQLERLLARRFEGLRVECVNAGVSGLRTAQVLDLLRTDLAGFQASAALVNLSNNDVDADRFGRTLDALAAELERRGIPSVFALEPNSLERRAEDSPHGDLGAKHAVVREVAARRGRPVIDLHAYLAERRDAGFVWWDFVHLTSFGQRLVATALANELPALVGPDAPAPVARSASASARAMTALPARFGWPQSCIRAEPRKRGSAAAKSEGRSSHSTRSCSTTRANAAS